ncbi:MAG: DUF1800 family protein [Propionibacteriaceae bacterium]|nr:DUF1800 family protein [Propionibacteriaceae bacterium]
MQHETDSGTIPAVDEPRESRPASDRRQLVRTLVGLAPVAAATALGAQPAAAVPAPRPGKTAPTSAPTWVPDDTPEAWHLARRFCGAPTAAIVAEIRALGTMRWFERQLRPHEIDDARMDAIAAGPLGLAGMAAPEIAARYDGATWMAADHALKLLMVRPVLSNRHVLDSTCEVLGDHLYIPIRGKANSFSAQHELTIRQHAFGKYADLLQAVLTQPAMLVHLDNHASTKEAPNENLGRELLELFTVGVGHYTETDVHQSTLLLTGQSYDWEARTYRYRPTHHHVGPLRIMGFNHPNPTAESGPEALQAYLAYLARHPATARRLARKFAIRFVSDTPSDTLIEAMANAYLAADTAIPPMLRALVNASEFWSSVGKKWRRPMELINTIIRAGEPQQFVPQAAELWRYTDMGDQGRILASVGHAPRHWHHVDGYPDAVGAWKSAQTMLGLWNATHEVCTENLNEFGRLDWERALGVRPLDPILASVRRIAVQLTGWEWTSRDIAAVASALRPGATISARDTFDRAALAELPHCVRLIFASPYAFRR